MKNILAMTDAEFTAHAREQAALANAARFGHDMPTEDAAVFTDLDWTLGELAKVEAEAARIDTRKRELREVVAAFMAETDAREIVRPLATVKLIAGSVRVSYDRKALDTLCRDDADLAFRLSPYRTETTTRPSVRVEWSTKEETR